MTDIKLKDTIIRSLSTEFSLYGCSDSTQVQGDLHNSAVELYTVRRNIIDGMLDVRIGVLGGGQLAKMMAQEARKLGLDIFVLDPSPDCPASSIARHVIGDFRKSEDVMKFSREVDVITYDIEDVDTTYLHKIKDKVFPSPEILDIVKDKLIQKTFLQSHNIPTTWFKEVTKIEDIDVFPSVQKSRKGGYDGRGTYIIRKKEDLKYAIRSPSYIEEFVEIEKELAIIVARNRRGDLSVFPVVEMVFVPERNILDMLIAPARVNEDVRKRVSDIAVRTIESLGGVGVFGIEFFLSKDGRILVNEIAPRPHNSGHYTIEACATSQFEQHIRAILGLPLGLSELLTPAVMINLLGEEGYYGKPIYENIEEVLEIPGVYIHIYGKRETFPYRKMGHITVIDKDLQRAIEKAKKVKERLKVKGSISKDSTSYRGLEKRF